MTRFCFTAVSLVYALVFSSYGHSNGDNSRNPKIINTKAMSTDQAEDVVIQRPDDQRQFKYLELDNTLKVLLISDVAAEKSAASLDIFVGAGDDPAERNGLAHFLEHMLFLGTEKYPDAEAFQAFVSGHGGDHNAYTSLMHTNYFFDVFPEHFEPALDRFAQFFISPLLDEKYVDREKNAVHSEFRARFDSESRRRRDVIREFVKPNHALANFTTGNLDTLADRKSKTSGQQNLGLREELLAFFSRHYSANNMALVISSPHSLDESEKWVREKFGSIPNRQTVPASYEASPFPDGFLPARIDIQPKKELRSVSFIFPIASTAPYSMQKPTQYLGNFIGHEGKGSLLDTLKKIGWATGLSAGGGSQWRGGETFNVNISLTEKGYKNVVTIERLLFHYIALLKKKGVKEWRFDELASLARTGFNYGEQTKAITEVTSLANEMHRVEPRYLLVDRYLYTDFDKSLINRYLDVLTRENMLVVVTSPDIVGEKESFFYGTPYRYYSLQDTPRISLSEVKWNNEDVYGELASRLKLPPKNKFVSKKFKIEEDKYEQALNDKPEVISRSPAHTVWFLNDNVYDVPKGYVNARYKLPFVEAGVDNYAVALVYTRILKDYLNVHSYEASLAGLSFSLYATPRGVDVGFYGYDDKLPQYVKKLTKIIHRYNNNVRFRDRLTTLYFDKVQVDLVRKEKNRVYDKVYSQLFRELPATLYAPYWSTEERLASLEKLTLERYSEAVPKMFDSAFSDYFVFGNFTEKEAKRLSSRMSTLAPKVNLTPNLTPSKVVNLGTSGAAFSKKVAVKSPDSSVLFYVQGENDTFAEQAKILLLQQALSSPFYNSLRTEQQLGYIVFSTYYPIKKLPGLVGVVQSPRVPADKLHDYIEQFFIDFKPNLLRNFARDRQAVIDSILEKPKNQSDLASRLWDSIISLDTQFNDDKRLISALQNVSEEELLHRYEQLLISGANRLVLFADQNPEFEGEFHSGFKFVGDRIKFKDSMPGYFYP